MSAPEPTVREPTPAPSPSPPSHPAPGPLTAWELFVLRHTKPGNLVVHGVSFVLFWVGWLAPLPLGDWRWWLLVPLSGPVGTAGHYLFRDGGVKLKEATVDPLVPFFVTRMFWRLARGTYAQDLARARARYAAHVGALPAALASPAPEGA